MNKSSQDKAVPKALLGATIVLFMVTVVIALFATGVVGPLAEPGTAAGFAVGGHGHAH